LERELFVNFLLNKNFTIFFGQKKLSKNQALILFAFPSILPSHSLDSSQKNGQAPATGLATRR
jgi:hypothetical protein